MTALKAREAAATLRVGQAAARERGAGEQRPYGFRGCVDTFAGGVLLRLGLHLSFL